MEEVLSKEEVLHVAGLARISLSEEDVTKYQKQLKQLIDDVDKIKEVSCEEKELFITPSEHRAHLQEDSSSEMVSFEEMKKNLPGSMGNFVEVPVMINE